MQYSITDNEGMPAEISYNDYEKKPAGIQILRQVENNKFDSDYRTISKGIFADFLPISAIIK